MHLGTHALLEFFRARQDTDSLVLATIIATAGSTYRKPGAMMLIARDGGYEGMISGGCLEGDLLHHAAAVFEAGSPARVTYDMHADEELVWNLGLGCDGVIHLLLQRLDRESGFGFLTPLDVAQRARRAGLLALVTQGDASLATGSFGLLDGAGATHGDPQLVQSLADLADDGWPRWRCRRLRLGAEDVVEDGAEAVAINLPARTRVLLCGAGPDAVPMARAFAGLDWDVLIADHRPAFAKPDRFPPGCTVIRTRPERLADALAGDGLDAAVIMSHHLDNDAAWLAQLAGGDIPYIGVPYIGVLGPRARRDRLLQMAGCQQAVYGPVGLDIGAELPAAIALAVAAEIHAVLNGRDGRPLTIRTDERQEA
jgi:xanthine/CO dehydrogenase XdhC/CoxF family maturation factor